MNFTEFDLLVGRINQFVLNDQWAHLIYKHNFWTGRLWRVSHSFAIILFCRFHSLFATKRANFQEVWLIEKCDVGKIFIWFWAKWIEAYRDGDPVQFLHHFPLVSNKNQEWIICNFSLNSHNCGKCCLTVGISFSDRKIRSLVHALTVTGSLATPKFGHTWWVIAKLQVGPSVCVNFAVAF